jgi:hypothetical protein
MGPIDSAASGDDFLYVETGISSSARQCSWTATDAAKMADFLAVEAVALPQLVTTRVGDSVEIPNVSPGQTDVSPNSGEIRTASDSQPREIENARR